MPRISRDLLFQAHCQVDYMQNEAEQGAIFESCDEAGVVELVLSDGSGMSIYLEPIERLIEALRRLPKPTA